MLQQQLEKEVRARVAVVADPSGDTWRRIATQLRSGRLTTRIERFAGA